MNDRLPTQPAGSGRRSLPDRRAGDRRVLVVGLLISAALHVVVLGLAGGWLAPDARRAPRPPEPVFAEPPRGMRAVELAVPRLDRERPEDPDEPEPREPDRQEPEPVVAQADADRAVPADTLTAADRLAPRIVDPGLWRPMVLMPREPTIDDVEARVAAAVGLLSDSALAAAEAALQARDWTVEDESGGKWGISPGKLHLGDLTLPLPIWFPVDPQVAAEQRKWYELERQLDRARVLEGFRERVQAIRERRDQEREERRNAENGGG